MAQKVTVMVLKVDLQCPCCYRKVNKILCKFPQIRDHIFNEKANTVTITVVCCDPEKIRDKLCCKGAGVIKSVDIKEPPKQEPIKTEPPKVTDNKPERSPTCKPPKQTPPCSPPPPPPSIPVCHPPVVPRRTCCGPCSEGYGGGPCFLGHGGLLPPQPCYAGYYWYGYGHVHGPSKCDYYFSEENPQACSIM